MRSLHRFVASVDSRPILPPVSENKALTAMRRQKPVTVEIETALAVASSPESPEQSVNHGDLQTAMEQALRELSANHREVMELTFYHELSYHEIAEIMQCPISNAKAVLWACCFSLRYGSLPPFGISERSASNCYHQYLNG